MTSFNADDAAQLLAQAQQPLAQRLDLVQTAVGDWSVLFDDGGAYRLEWSDDWARLMFTGVLGTPSAQHERAALNLALSYNALWREVGNLRMARETPDGTLLLIGELGLENTPADALASALLHFEGLRRRWAQGLMGAQKALAEPAAPLLGPFERF